MLKTIKRTGIYQAPAEIVFGYLDKSTVTGVHYKKVFRKLMGCKLQMEYLTMHQIGLDSTCRFTGTMMGKQMDFTVAVTKWVEGVEKVCETVGETKMIIYSWVRLHLLVYPKENETLAELSVTFRRRKGWFLKIISFLFAGLFCNWFIKNLLQEAKRKTEQEKKIFSEMSGNQVNKRGQTNWYVITGGPGSGKTTSIHLLHQRGYKTTIEHARHYIDTQRITGKSVAEIRNNQIAFQTGIIRMQLEQEENLLRDDIVFLDRALPDSLAYYRFLHLPEDFLLQEALRHAAYKKIFILDYLPLIKDYARVEDGAAQKKIHSLITAVYESLPFPVVHVPVLPPEERVDYILKNL
jgi:predicted ATPase